MSLVVSVSVSVCVSEQGQNTSHCHKCFIKCMSTCVGAMCVVAVSSHKQCKQVKLSWELLLSFAWQHFVICMCAYAAASCIFKLPQLCQAALKKVHQDKF